MSASYEKVLITGVHTGLGHALAARCLELGARVYALSRTEPADLAGAERLRFVPLDLRRFDEIHGVIGELLDGVGSLDLAILNAG